MEIFAYILAVVIIGSTVFAIFSIIGSDDRIRRISKNPGGSADPPPLSKPARYLNDPRPGD